MRTREWLSVEHISANELGQNIQLIRINVRNPLDYSAWNHVKSRNEASQENSPPRE